MRQRLIKTQQEYNELMNMFDGRPIAEGDSSYPREYPCLVTYQSSYDRIDEVTDIYYFINYMSDFNCEQ